MLRQPVESSNLKSVGFDAERQVLEVEFLNGAIYQYDGVPPSVHTQLMSASSHGSYFSANIQNVYPYRRV